MISERFQYNDIRSLKSPISSPLEIKTGTEQRHLHIRLLHCNCHTNKLAQALYINVHIYQKYYIVVYSVLKLQQCLHLPHFLPGNWWSAIGVLFTISIIVTVISLQGEFSDTGEHNCKVLCSPV